MSEPSDWAMDQGNRLAARLCVMKRHPDCVPECITTGAPCRDCALGEPGARAAAIMLDAAYQRGVQEERERVKLAHKADTQQLAEALQVIIREVEAREWLLDGRGPYEWDDEKYQKEAGWCMEAVRTAAIRALNESGKVIAPEPVLRAPAPAAPTVGGATTGDGGTWKLAAPTPEDATKEETCEGCKYAHGRKVPVSSSYPCESCRRFPTAEILDYYTQEKPVPATVKGESQ